MHLWLTKCHGGRYLLTVLKPTIHRIRGTRHLDAYEVPGEPIAVRYLCEPGVQAMFGAALPALTPTKVRITGEITPANPALNRTGQG